MHDVEDLAPFFKDQIGVVFANNEAPAVAKVLHEFAKENEALKLVAGCLDSTMLSVKNDIVRISNSSIKRSFACSSMWYIKAPIARFCACT